MMKIDQFDERLLVLENFFTLRTIFWKLKAVLRYSYKKLITKILYAIKSVLIVCDWIEIQHSIVLK